MAKKTSKTAHVLNLISRPETTETQTPASTETKPETEMQEPVTSKNTETRRISSPMRTSLERAAKSEELSNQVKENIEKEFEELLSHTEAPLPQDTAQSTEYIPAEKEEIVSIQPAAVSSEEPQNIQKEDSSIDDAPTPSKSQETEKVDFQIINVPEVIIRQKAPEYVKKFCSCQCARCTADVIALALTNLPPKYAVTNKGENSSVMIGYYENTYRVRILTEVTKACLKVGQSPRHTAQ